MKDKIKLFIRRNEKRNKHLWESDKIMNYDYIICPVTQTRLSMIKSNYIENTLCMSIEEFDKKFPNQQKMCLKRIENIKRGLKSIDRLTGLTKHQLSIIKARKTLTTKDINGFTGDNKRAIKTRKSNFNNIVNGKNGYQRTAEKARPKQIRTMSEQGKISKYNFRNEWEIYKKFVWFLTNKNKPKTKKNVGRGKGKYSLDHKISVCYGFNNNISPFLISNKHNMEYIKFEDNSSKWTACSITVDQLYKYSGYDYNKNYSEWDKYSNAVKYRIDNCVSYSNQILLREINDKTE